MMLAFALGLLPAIGATCAHAQPQGLRTPAPGVLCDQFICADSKGVSQILTETYLGRKAAAKAFSQGPFDVTAFTFANGIFCDTKERLCRVNRYYGANGKHDGAVSGYYTRLLFGD